jgi:hypothetical protein
MPGRPRGRPPVFIHREGGYSVIYPYDLLRLAEALLDLLYELK